MNYICTFTKYGFIFLNLSRAQRRSAQITSPQRITEIVISALVFLQLLFKFLGSRHQIHVTGNDLHKVHIFICVFL
jgi:hypothetical protein